MQDDSLRDFLAIPYDRLEKMNLEAKTRRIESFGKPQDEIKKYYLDYLKKEKKIKAVTVCFSDIEGRFHLLDYNKDFFVEAYDNLTFDGSSIRGFSQVSESDLRLKIDWPAFYWLPADVFGSGKVIVFADIYTGDGKPHMSDFRSRLRLLSNDLFKKRGVLINAANEIEGFLVRGVDAEANFDEKNGFELASSGGYYHSLPKDTLKLFIDTTAEAHRAMGFENEKDHPEVAPSQFELNYKHANVNIAADYVQLYKLVARQVAENMGMTATFLPKPRTMINGSGMHTNISFEKAGKNIFFDPKDKFNMSKMAYSMIDRILESAAEISLILNPSVNAYRRLDPNFEAPNQIKYSAIDRTSMIRIPLANKNSVRIEVRSVAPDVNPYLLYFALIKTGLEGPTPQKTNNKRIRTKTLPGNIYDALRIFNYSDFTTKLMGEGAKEKYVALKKASANRCPRELGTKVKTSEVIYHHEVTNQILWSSF